MEKIFKSPLEQVNNLIEPNDELDDFIDDIYENHIDYDTEYDAGDGYMVTFSPSRDKYNSDFEVFISKDNDELDSFNEWYPRKKMRESSRKDLASRIRNIITGGK